MAFDAGMLAAVAHEIEERVGGARIEKIHGPSRDEVVIIFRPDRGRSGARVLISAGANSPRIRITEAEISNPAQPPIFIQLLRKHLGGGKLIEVRQQGFERALELVFEAHDELEFRTTRYLICEIMGKYSNIMLCDSNRKILAAIKTVDITTSQKRQVIPGMIYEEPPAQNKRNPLSEDKSAFLDLFNESVSAPEKFVMNNYMGVSPLVSREITLGCEGDGELMWKKFSAFTERIKNKEFTPVLIRDGDEKPCEYCFMPIAQYDGAYTVETVDSFGGLLDRYFTERGRVDRVRQKAADLYRLLENARARLERKLEGLRTDIAACADMESYKRNGDLITSNMYLIEKGARSARLIDYYDENMPEVTVSLDSRLTASQNAQKYYKKYNKLKKGEVELTKQIEIAESELVYINSVADEFSRAESETDISEIRRELYEAGYAQRMKNYTPQKMRESKPMEFRTDGGYRVLCGRNNIQNDRLTHKLADRGDYWFHVKDAHGSHAVMFCAGDDDPPAEDFTQAAMIAAYYSEFRDGKNVEVDYTLVRNLKKPPSAKPGYVIYHTNYSAVVTPNAETVERLRVK